MTTNNYIELSDYKYFEVKGNDRVQFLQAIITNDINKCTIDNAIYSALLTPQGKFISDFFIINLGKSFLFEIHKEFLEDTIDKFEIYKLRAKIEISNLHDYKSIAIYNLDNSFNFSSTSGKVKKIGSNYLYNDPRNTKMGLRGVILKKELEKFCVNYNLLKGKVIEYNENRINNLIPDASKDLKVNKSLLLENNFESINCIDWNKGCYIGQEITARMKYRSLIKKSLKKITITSGNVTVNDNIFMENKNIGNVTSVSKKVALAMIKTDDAKKSLDNNLILKTENGKVEIDPNFI